MMRLFVAALCAVFALAFAGDAMAGSPIHGTIVKGGKNPGGNANKVVIEMGGEAWAYDPVGGTITPTAPEPAATRGEAVNPIPGIGITVKRRPGDGAAIVVPVGENGSSTMPRLEDGSYDLVIRIPNGSMPGKPRSLRGKGVEITFSLTVKGGEVTHSGKGAGSPKQAGF